MKIGYFSHSSISASETFIYDLLVGLAHKGLDVTYYCGASSVSTITGVQSVITEFDSSKSRSSKLVYYLGQILNGNGSLLKGYFDSKKAYNALHSRLSKNLPDVAYIDYGTSAVLVREFLVRSKIPYVVHFHGYDITSSLVDATYKKNLSQVFNEAKFIIAASHHIKRLLILAGCPSFKIKVVKLGITVDEKRYIKWDQKANTDPSLIFVGRLTQKKNPIALIYAFNLVKAKIPNVKLTIIGDGPLYMEVTNLVNSLKLTDSVKMLGELRREEIFTIIASHWIYVQHSVTSLYGDQEGFAISIAEAAAYGLPVVSTLHNGIPENVIDGITGYLVREFDFETMADKIIELIMNPEKIKILGVAGRSNVLENFKHQDRVSAIEKILLETVNS